MTNIVPGAIWQPVDVAGRSARVKGRGAVGHVAVSGSPNLLPSGSAATRGADWHFYLPKVGNTNGSVRFFQYIDLDLTCWASQAGNATLPAWESEGGLGTEAQVNAEPWTENQLNAAAIIYAHLARTEGAPLQVMPDSRPTSRGLAAHRFGIDPWRVPGGETWSGPGKLCPGTAKVAQLPEIIARARQLLNPSGGFLMALSDAEQAEIRDTLRELRYVGKPFVGAPTHLAAAVGDVFLHARTAAAQAAIAAKASDPAAIAAAVVAALPSGTGNLSEADVESALRKVLGSLDNTPAS